MFFGQRLSPGPESIKAAGIAIPVYRALVRNPVSVGSRTSPVQLRLSI